MLEEAVTEGTMSYQTSIFVISPLVVTFFAHGDNSERHSQDSAQALAPVERMGKHMTVESCSRASSYIHSTRDRE
jgi:hypothetical protein